MRFVTLDIETTGFEKKGHGASLVGTHRIIEIGCSEIENGAITKNTFQKYINPGRSVDEKAKKVHGIGDEKLKNAESFEDIKDDLFEFIKGSVVIIHNAPFDLSFIDAELDRLPEPPKGRFKFIDTLELARQVYPGRDNSLDALARISGVTTNRKTHGALVDSNILAQVFVAKFLKFFT